MPPTLLESKGISRALWGFWGGQDVGLGERLRGAVKPDEAGGVRVWGV